MKRQMFLATVFSAAFAVAAAAQNPPQTPPTGSQERSQAPQVTLTGCVAQADSSATGTSGTAGTTAAGAQYILKNATMGTGSPSSTGTSGAAAPAAGAGKSYKLVGSSSDLKDNLNAKVEVKGTIERSSASSSTTGSATGTGTAASGSQSDKDMQTLRVTSVKKISDSCQ